MKYFDNIWFWIIAVVLIIGLDVLSAIKGYRKHGIKGLRCDLKKSWNSLTPMFNMILAAYFVVIALIPMQSIEDFVKKQLIGLFGLSQVVVRLIPLGYTIIVLTLVCRIVFYGLIPSIKYNTEEIQWQKESNVKFNKKIREWLHIKPKTEDVIK